LRPLFLNRAQKEYAQRCGKRNIVLKARQLGVTTYVAARFFVHTVTHPGTLSVQVAHDQQSAEEIFRIVHRFVENLPAPLRKGALRTSHANVRQVIFPVIDCQYQIATAGDPNAGRGLTIQNLHCSEVARWPRDAAGTLASLRAAVPPGGEIVLESTPNGACGCFYDEWLRAHETGYTRHFFPWWWEPTYRRNIQIVNFTDTELKLMQKHGLDAGQIAFRREMRANFGSRMTEEYAEDSESCFMASGDCVFDIEVVDRRMRETRTVVEQRDNAKLLVFFPAINGDTGATAKEYIIGVDPAGGGSDGDFACAQVLERGSGVQCAELQGHFTPAELAARVAVIGREYNNALIAVERNNHGHAVLAQLTMHEGYNNVYYQGNQAGWLTSAASRPRMLENFAATLTNAPFLFSSTRLLEECRTFVRHPDGSASAASGTHDDLVMSMGVALAVRAEMAPNAGRKPATVSVGSLG
jgi:Terminase RNaseH-like domain